MDWTMLHLMAPELAALAALLICLGYDYSALRHEPAFVREPAALKICVAGLLAAITASLILLRVGKPHGTLLDGQITVTVFTLSLKAFIYAGALICLIFSRGAARLQHISEYHALFLLSAIGLGVAVSTRNVLIIFLALELSALCQYSLTGLDRTRAATEAAFKYFTFGATASAFFLFGISYLYGGVNLLSLAQMAPAISAVALPSALLTTAYLFILAGLGFKLAAAPFHFWAPETYRSAPTPVAAWIAGPSKLAAMAVLVQMLLPTLDYPLLRADWIAALSFIAALSLILGTLGALRQTQLKRLLAYSAVAHAGYTLIGVAAGTRDGFTAAIFYSILYVLATLVAFGVVLLACERQGRPATLEGLRGLAGRSPLLAALLLASIITLAGVPPLPGFFGKYFLFAAAIGSRSLLPAWPVLPYVLVGLGLAASAVSLYYYFLILKAALVSESEDTPPSGAAANDYEDDGDTGPSAVRNALSLARQDYETKRALPELLALWVLVLLLGFAGIFPAPLLDLIAQGLKEL